MNRIFLTFVLTALPFWAHGQANEAIQRSSSPSGLRVGADGAYVTGGSYGAMNSTAPTSSNSGKNAQERTLQAAGQGSVQIQGNTRLNASARNLNAASLGKDNAAGNEVGSIGKK